MKVFLSEFVCGGGVIDWPDEAIDESLRLEGTAMLAAVADDLAQIGASLVIPCDPRFQVQLPPCQRLEIRSGESIWTQWAQAALGCDAAIIIAPERDGGLARAVGMLRAAGVDVIASSGDFLRVASDKQLTARALIAAGVPHPITLLPTDPRAAARLRLCERFIVKPRDGCGTASITLYDDLDEALNVCTDRDLLQHYQPGLPASIAVIVNGSSMNILPAVSQTVSLENCSYLGGRGPLSDDHQRRAAMLAQGAIMAMPPSARGFIGLDLILGDDADGDVVLEINPRLTTSYVGLRQMVAGNLAKHLLGLESDPVQCKVAVGEVSWTRDGVISFHRPAVEHG